MDNETAFKFYAKYPQEMDAVFDGEISSEEVLNFMELIDEISVNAGLFVKSILKKCIERISFEFEEVYFVKPIIPRVYHWSIKTKISKKRQNSSKKFPLYTGLFFETCNDKNNIVAKCWVWFKYLGSKNIDNRAKLQQILNNANITSTIFENEDGGITAYILESVIDVPENTPIDQDVIIQTLTDPILKLKDGFGFLLNL